MNTDGKLEIIYKHIEHIHVSINNIYDMLSILDSKVSSIKQDMLSGDDYIKKIVESKEYGNVLQHGDKHAKKEISKETQDKRKPISIKYVKVSGRRKRT